MMRQKRVLVIEDETDIRELIAINLRDVGYEVVTASTGAAGLRAATGPQTPDVILLDLMLPDVDGIDICRQLRADGSLIPIVMLTARDTETDRVLGLEMGADDYLTKPFSVRELQARVKAILRRVEMTARPADAPTEINVGELHINCVGRTVILSDQKIELTSTEFDLLVYLASHPARVFSRTQLLDQVWGYQHAGYEHTVSSHINRLRSKIEPDASHPQYVLTVWGVGYKFTEY